MICATGCTTKEPEQTGQEDKPLPVFDLLLTDSSTHISTSSMQPGQPVVLFYFGPNCPYSRAQMDGIIEHISLLKDIKFCVFTDWPFTEMKSFYKHYQLEKYSNMVVGNDYKSFFRSYFKVKGVPYMAIYGKNMRLNQAFKGKMSEKQIYEIAWTQNRIAQ